MFIFYLIHCNYLTLKYLFSEYFSLTNIVGSILPDCMAAMKDEAKMMNKRETQTTLDVIF